MTPLFRDFLAGLAGAVVVVGALLLVVRWLA